MTTCLTGCTLAGWVEDDRERWSAPSASFTTMVHRKRPGSKVDSTGHGLGGGKVEDPGDLQAPASFSLSPGACGSTEEPYYLHPIRDSTSVPPSQSSCAMLSPVTSLQSAWDLQTEQLPWHSDRQSPLHLLLSFVRKRSPPSHSPAHTSSRRRSLVIPIARSWAQDVPRGKGLFSLSHPIRGCQSGCSFTWRMQSASIRLVTGPPRGGGLNRSRERGSEDAVQGRVFKRLLPSTAAGGCLAKALCED